MENKLNTREVYYGFIEGLGSFIAPTEGQRAPEAWDINYAKIEGMLDD